MQHDSDEGGQQQCHLVKRPRECRGLVLGRRVVDDARVS
jgi:hypothetical protein